MDSVILPIIYMVRSSHYQVTKDRPEMCIEYSAWMYVGVNSVITSAIVVGLTSQLWLRKRHPGWYKKYNYILGGALDGGAQVMVFILSFAVFGASGVERPFPTVSSTTSVGRV